MRLRSSGLLVTSIAIVFAISACSGGRAPADGPQIPPPSDVAAPPADAARTSTNLASKVIKSGTGTRYPRPNSMVTVHYTGWTTAGRMIDSSVARGSPAHFSVDGVIPGWTEGLQLMIEGETRRFWIPGPLAYDGTPGKPQGMLVFDVELIKIDS